MAWYIAVCRPATLFSLKASTATSSGARTNLIPTMYGVKMGLVDAAFRAGLDGEAVFEWVKDRAVRFEPPETAVVNNTFIKILRKPHSTGEEIAFISSVAYREFVAYSGNLKIAIDVNGLDAERCRILKILMYHVNYLGKRGSFLQTIKVTESQELSASFGYVVGDSKREHNGDGVVQYLDDFGPDATFETVNSYSDQSIRLGRERVIVPVLLPYRQTASSRGYTMFTRTVP